MPQYEKEKKTLSFGSVGELTKISEDVKVTINNAFQCKQYCKAANDIFRKADNFYKTSDEEQAYMLFMRYFYIIQNIKKSYEFVKSKNTYMTILKECSMNSAMTNAEELSTSLHTRYEKRQLSLLEKEENEKKKAIENASVKKSQSGGIPNTNKSSDNLILPEVPDDFVSTTDTSDDVGAGSSGLGEKATNNSSNESQIYPTKGVLSVTELYTFIKEYKDNLDSIMIIDIRPMEEFADSRINHKCIINVPENLLQHGANINSIERKLNKQTWEIWSSRFAKKVVIIMNYEFDIDVSAKSSSLFLLHDVLCKFEGSYQALILNGGFKQWILHYPSMTTNPFYSKKPSIPTLLDSAALLKDLTYPELPRSENKRSEPVIPPEAKQPSTELNDLLPHKSSGIATQKFSGPRDVFKDALNEEEGKDLILSRNKKISTKEEFHFSDPNINEKKVPDTPSNINKLELPTIPHPTATVNNVKPLINRDDNTIANISSSLNTVNTISGVVDTNINNNNNNNRLNNFNPMGVNTGTGIPPSSFNDVTIPSPVVNQSINHPASMKTNFVPTIPTSISNNINVVMTTSPIQLNTSTSTASSPASSNIPTTSIMSVIPQPTILTNNPLSSILPNNPPSSILPNNPSSSILKNNPPSSILPNNPPSSILPNNPSSSIASSNSNNHNVAAQSNTRPVATPLNINDSNVEPRGKFTPQVGTSLPMSTYKEATLPANTLPTTNTIHPVNAAMKILPSSIIQPPVSSVSEVAPQPISNPNNIPPVASNSPQVRLTQNLENSKQTSQVSPHILNQPPLPTHVQAPEPSPKKINPNKANVTTTFGLPHGWEKAVSHETGRIYYKDHNTHTTHWTLPPEILAHVHQNDSSPLIDDPNKASKHISPPQASSNVENKSSLKRSLSSPNLADMADTDSVENITKEKDIPARPVIDRSAKPKEQKQVLVDRTKKPISASRLHNLSPVYGSLGHALTGLKNLGNTCYMNSVIQCLSNTTPLSKYFTSGLYEQHLNTSNMNSRPGEIARELSFVIIVLSAGQYRSISPLDFKHALGRFSSHFNGSQQQDSHELLMFLLDGLHEDINKVKSRQTIKDRGNDNLPDPPAAEQAWSDYLSNNESIIVDLFQGQFRSTVVCLSCGQESKTFDAFNCLQLELPANRSSTLQSCITSFTKAEKIGGNDSWKCSKCKCYREASKTIEVWKVPPVLIIQLKRFRCDGRWRNKIQTAINFPLGNLNMADHIVAPNTRFSKYHLYAVINHYGSFESGHYTAFCENASTGKWYCFDDNIVKELDAGAIKTNAAYLLFYTSVDFKDYVKK